MRTLLSFLLLFVMGISPSMAYPGYDFELKVIQKKALGGKDFKETKLSGTITIKKSPGKSVGKVVAKDLGDWFEGEFTIKNYSEEAEEGTYYFKLIDPESGQKFVLYYKSKEGTMDFFNEVDFYWLTVRAMRLEPKIEAPKLPNDTSDTASKDPVDIFTLVDQMPQFPGGEAELFKYLGQNLNYPKAARKAGIAGKVLVSFVVMEDGSIDDVWLYRGIGGVEAECIRVVRGMPAWEPGMHRGKAIRVEYMMPIKFSL
ncbi:MAG: energy transducer TonB [Salibacteraceae bacterium]